MGKRKKKSNKQNLQKKSVNQQKQAQIEKPQPEKPQPEKPQPEKPQPEKPQSEPSQPAQPQPVPVQADPEESVKAFWKHPRFLIGAASAGVVLAVYVGGIFAMSGKFLPNTKINGIDVSNITVAEAEQKLASLADNYTLTLKERGAEETITAEQTGYRYQFDGEAQRLLDGQKIYLWPAAYFTDRSYTVSAAIRFDEDMLQETVDALQCFAEDIAEAPKDAYLRFHDGEMQIVKEVQGKQVKKKRLKKVIKEALLESRRVLSLDEEKCYVKPKVTSDDKVLNCTVENMNPYLRTRIVYHFGEKEEILDGQTVRNWLTVDEKGNVTLNEEKAASYVEYLAVTYDTAGKPRVLKTNDGSEVTVEGGSYGWLIDQEAETAELLELVKAGQRKARQPLYAQTAVSRQNSDLGLNYVEVDLTNQHVWMYIGGEEIVSTDMVSGTYTNLEKRTPPGTYTVTYKKSPAVLRGPAEDPYESHVSYWMPFNGGIGLHDANWRGSFGGSIFMYSGSHGCVNLPTDAARTIYENIYAGMPVICYYRDE